jgi:hypothetical protein
MRIRRDEEALGSRAIEDMKGWDIIMDTTRPWNRTLQECIAISNFGLQMLNSCSRCVGEFGDAEQGICQRLYAYKKTLHHTKIISPQSPGSPAY